MPHRLSWGLCLHFHIDEGLNSSLATLQEILITPAAGPSLCSLFNLSSPFPHPPPRGVPEEPLHKRGGSDHSSPAVQAPQHCPSPTPREWFSGPFHTDQPWEERPMGHPKRWALFTAEGTGTRNRPAGSLQSWSEGSVHCVVASVAFSGTSPHSHRTGGGREEGWSRGIGRDRRAERGALALAAGLQQHAYGAGMSPGAFRVVRIRGRESRRRVGGNAGKKQR